MGRRVFIVAGLWFAFWMILAAAFGGWMADPANRSNGIYFGFFRWRVVGAADKLHLAVAYARCH